MYCRLGAFDAKLIKNNGLQTLGAQRNTSSPVCLPIRRDVSKNYLNAHVSLLCLKGGKKNQTEHLIFGKRNKVTKFAYA